MIRQIYLIFVAYASLAAQPTRNHMRVAVTTDARRGTPVLAAEELPADFSPDSVRVAAPGSADFIPAKTDWRAPQARITWISRGRGTYQVSSDVRGAGETARLPAPARFGSGDRITYGPAGIRGRLLNLAAGRGGASGRRKIELADWTAMVSRTSSPDSPEGPIWYENIGTRENPVMKRRGLILKTKFQGRNPTPCVVDWNGDGKLDTIVGAEDGFFCYCDRNFIDRS